ncbi:MAG: response regulator, partial [Acidimicrobiales bacterium]|nr:response regulator [Acidimicrobiales bacterium]
MNVLVVEDEESYREALVAGLRLEGFEVEVAADGYEALDLVERTAFDIVLLDMLLPGMHGIEVCRRMRALSQVPIMMVSAVDTELDVVLGLELGAAGYVTKPFRLRELVAR